MAGHFQKHLFVTIIISLFALNTSYSQDFLPKLDQTKSIQHDSVSFYYKDTWMKSQDINKNDIPGFLNRAQRKIELGFIKEALSDVEKAISIDSTIGHSYFLKGYLLLKQDSIKSALYNFNKSVAFNDTNIYNYYYRAEIYSRMRNISEAEFCYNKAIQKDNKFADAYFGLANLHLMKYEFNEAENLYKKVIKLKPDFSFAYFNMGLLHIFSDNIKSMKYINKTIEISPDFAQAYYIRGFLYMFRNDISATYSDWNKATELDPNNSLYHVVFGLYRIHNKSYESGIKEIIKAKIDYRVSSFLNYFEKSVNEKILNDFISQVNTYYMYSDKLTSEERLKTINALSLFLDGNFYSAKEVYTELINSSSSCKGLFLYLRGLNCEYLKDAELAIDDYKSAVSQKIFPNEVYLRYGIVLNYFVRNNEAINCFKKFLINNDMRLVHVTLANLYIIKSKSDSAIYEYNKLITSDSTDLTACFDRATCYKNMERYQDAIKDCSYIIHQKPFDIEANCLLAECKYTTGDTAGTFNILNTEFNATHNLTSKGFFILGSINLSNMKYDSAIICFNKVISLNSKHLEALIYRGLCYYCKEDFVKAKIDFTSAIEINKTDITALYTRGLTNIKLNIISEAYSDLKRAEIFGHPLAKRAILIYLKDYKPPEFQN